MVLLAIGLLAVTQNLLIYRITQLLRQLQDFIVIGLAKDCFCKLPPRPMGRLRILTARNVLVCRVVVRHPAPHGIRNHGCGET